MQVLAVDPPNPFGPFPLPSKPAEPEPDVPPSVALRVLKAARGPLYRYKPHQGAAERARRQRQAERQRAKAVGEVQA